MNASYEWLRAFVPFSQSPAELRDLITARVAAVDELVQLRADLAPIVIARVVTEGPHPDSDHLHVTTVDAGTGELLDVVCGAPNVTAGKLYPFAPTGTTMPNGIKIEKRKIRGAVSNGMLCSARELGLGQEHDGILELDLGVAPGTPLLAAMPLGDTRIVIDVGANRPDLLSHLGIARELAALTGEPLVLPDVGIQQAPPVPASAAAKDHGHAGPVDVRVADPALVRRFMGVVIRGVRVGPSPEWLVRRLESVGSRSINNVVDASNYILHELGQPTHAFDLSKLSGSTLVARLARAGETIVTLDGTTRTLNDQMIVIADASHPQAVAGVMGGRDSEVTEATTDIYLEVANFDPARVRNARRALGLSTDASYRFERGVDVDLAPRALERTARLIMSLAGGSVDGAPVDLGRRDGEATQVAVRPARVERVLGVPIPTKEIVGLLTSIGFTTANGANQQTASLTFNVPSWRADATAEVDAIEEIARLRGYDSFPMELRPGKPSAVPDAPDWITARRIREELVGLGLLEVKPLPFVAGGDDYVRVENPLSEAEAHLRRTVLESLAARAEYNLARMTGDIRIFEIGSAFEPARGSLANANLQKGVLPREELRVAALIMGRRLPPHFSDPKDKAFERWVRISEWDVRGLAERVAHAAYPAARVELTPAETGPDLWHIVVDGRSLGRVARMQLDAPVWAAPAFGVELSLGQMDSTPVTERLRAGDTAAAPASQRRYEPIPVTPASEVDLALLVPAGVSAEAVAVIIRRNAGDILERLTLFDEYVGGGLENAARSLAWRLTFRHAERTLRDKEIEGRRSKILSALADELNVRQRTT